MNLRLSLSDLAGLAYLALDGARLITNVVEGVHATVLSTVAVPLNPVAPAILGLTSAIGSGVYRVIDGGYDLAEGALTAAFELFGSTQQSMTPASSPERERALAVLNGVWGDHLVEHANPLAIEMSFRHGGAPLILEPGAIRAGIPAPGRKLLVLVHGLCMNDLGWQQGGQDYGAKPAADHGYTAIYLHYNSGLHVSTNGCRLSDLLEALVEAWPEPVEELSILGFSMGGLVARSAVHYGTQDDRRWRRALRRLVFLGTPHHGSQLERAGNRAGELLNHTPYSAPFRRLGVTRSAGITDLRHGNVADADWHGLERSGHHHDTRLPIPLPSDVQCYAIAATLGTRRGDAKDRLLGDGFVPVASALGEHAEPERRLHFPEAQRLVCYETSHFGLLNCPQVYEQLREWLVD